MYFEGLTLAVFIFAGIAVSSTKGYMQIFNRNQNQPKPSTESTSNIPITENINGGDYPDKDYLSPDYYDDIPKPRTEDYETYSPENIGEEFQKQQFGSDNDYEMALRYGERLHQQEDNSYNEHEMAVLSQLEATIPGVPGVDYPIYQSLPETSFQCESQKAPGFYGDMEAQCQVFHICQEDDRQDSFLCPIGTVFNQLNFVCDWWFNFNCTLTPNFYRLNMQFSFDGQQTTEKTMTAQIQKAMERMQQLHGSNDGVTSSLVTFDDDSDSGSNRIDQMSNKMRRDSHRNLFAVKRRSRVGDYALIGTEKDINATLTPESVNDDITALGSTGHSEASSTMNAIDVHSTLQNEVVSVIKQQNYSVEIIKMQSEGDLGSVQATTSAIHNTLMQRPGYSLGLDVKKVNIDQPSKLVKTTNIEFGEKLTVNMFPEHIESSSQLNTTHKLTRSEAENNAKALILPSSSSTTTTKRPNSVALERESEIRKEEEDPSEINKNMSPAIGGFRKQYIIQNGTRVSFSVSIHDTTGRSRLQWKKLPGIRKVLKLKLKQTARMKPEERVPTTTYYPLDIEFRKRKPDQKAKSRIMWISKNNSSRRKMDWNAFMKNSPQMAIALPLVSISDNIQDEATKPPGLSFLDNLTEPTTVASKTEKLVAHEIVEGDLTVTSTEPSRSVEIDTSTIPVSTSSGSTEYLDELVANEHKPESSCQAICIKLLRLLNEPYHMKLNRTESKIENGDSQLKLNTTFNESFNRRSHLGDDRTEQWAVKYDYGSDCYGNEDEDKILVRGWSVIIDAGPVTKEKTVQRRPCNRVLNDDAMQNFPENTENNSQYNHENEEINDFFIPEDEDINFDANTNTERKDESIQRNEDYNEYESESPRFYEERSHFAPLQQDRTSDSDNQERWLALVKNWLSKTSEEQIQPLALTSERITENQQERGNTQARPNYLRQNYEVSDSKLLNRDLNTLSSGSDNKLVTKSGSNHRIFNFANRDRRWPGGKISIKTERPVHSVDSTILRELPSQMNENDKLALERGATNQRFVFRPRSDYDSNLNFERPSSNFERNPFLRNIRVRGGDSNSETIFYERYDDSMINNPNIDFANQRNRYDDTQDTEKEFAAYREPRIRQYPVQNIPEEIPIVTSDLIDTGRKISSKYSNTPRNVINDEQSLQDTVQNVPQDIPIVTADLIDSDFSTRDSNVPRNVLVGKFMSKADWLKERFPSRVNDDTKANEEKIISKNSESNQPHKKEGHRVGIGSQDRKKNPRHFVSKLPHHQSGTLQWFPDSQDVIDRSDTRNDESWRRPDEAVDSYHKSKRQSTSDDNGQADWLDSDNTDHSSRAKGYGWRDSRKPKDDWTSSSSDDEQDWSKSQGNVPSNRRTKGPDDWDLGGGNSEWSDTSDEEIDKSSWLSNQDENQDWSDSQFGNSDWSDSPSIKPDQSDSSDWSGGARNKGDWSRSRSGTTPDYSRQSPEISDRSKDRSDKRSWSDQPKDTQSSDTAWNKSPGKSDWADNAQNGQRGFSGQPQKGRGDSTRNGRPNKSKRPQNTKGTRSNQPPSPVPDTFERPRNSKGGWIEESSKPDLRPTQTRNSKGNRFDEPQRRVDQSTSNRSKGTWTDQSQVGKPDRPRQNGWSDEPQNIRPNLSPSQNRKGSSSDLPKSRNPDFNQRPQKGSAGSPDSSRGGKRDSPKRPQNSKGGRTNQAQDWSRQPQNGNREPQRSSKGGFETAQNKKNVDRTDKPIGGSRNYDRDLSYQRNPNPPRGIEDWSEQSKQRKISWSDQSGGRKDRSFGVENDKPYRQKDSDDDAIWSSPSDSRKKPNSPRNPQNDSPDWSDFTQKRIDSQSSNMRHRVDNPSGVAYSKGQSSSRRDWASDQSDLSNSPMDSDDWSSRSLRSDQSIRDKPDSNRKSNKGGWSSDDRDKSEWPSNSKGRNWQDEARWPDDKPRNKRPESANPAFPKPSDKWPDHQNNRKGAQSNPEDSWNGAQGNSKGWPDSSNERGVSMDQPWPSNTQKGDPSVPKDNTPDDEDSLPMTKDAPEDTGMDMKQEEMIKWSMQIPDNGDVLSGWRPITLRPQLNKDNSSKGGNNKGDRTSSKARGGNSKGSGWTSMDKKSTSNGNDWSNKGMRGSDRSSDKRGNSKGSELRGDNRGNTKGNGWNGDDGANTKSSGRSNVSRGGSDKSKSESYKLSGWNNEGVDENKRYDDWDGENIKKGDWNDNDKDDWVSKDTWNDDDGTSKESSKNKNKRGSEEGELTMRNIPMLTDMEIQQNTTSENELQSTTADSQSNEMNFDVPESSGSDLFFIPIVNRRSKREHASEDQQPARKPIERIATPTYKILKSGEIVNHPNRDRDHRFYIAQSGISVGLAIRGNSKTPETSKSDGRRSGFRVLKLSHDGNMTIMHNSIQRRNNLSKIENTISSAKGDLVSDNRHDMSTSITNRYDENPDTSYDLPSVSNDRIMHKERHSTSTNERSIAGSIVNQNVDGTGNIYNVSVNIPDNTYSLSDEIQAKFDSRINKGALDISGSIREESDDGIHDPFDDIYDQSDNKNQSDDIYDQSDNDNQPDDVYDQSDNDNQSDDDDHSEDNEQSDDNYKSENNVQLIDNEQSYDNDEFVDNQSVDSHGTSNDKYYTSYAKDSESRNNYKDFEIKDRSEGEMSKISGSHSSDTEKFMVITKKHNMEFATDTKNQSLDGRKVMSAIGSKTNSERERRNNILSSSSVLKTTENENRETVKDTTLKHESSSREEWSVPFDGSNKPSSGWIPLMNINFTINGTKQPPDISKANIPLQINSKPLNRTRESSAISISNTHMTAGNLSGKVVPIHQFITSGIVKNVLPKDIPGILPKEVSGVMPKDIHKNTSSDMSKRVSDVMTNVLLKGRSDTMSKNMSNVMLKTNHSDETSSTLEDDLNTGNSERTVRVGNETLRVFSFSNIMKKFDKPDVPELGSLRNSPNDQILWNSPIKSPPKMYPLTLVKLTNPNKNISNSWTFLRGMPRSNGSWILMTGNKSNDTNRNMSSSSGEILSIESSKHTYQTDKSDRYPFTISDVKQPRHRNVTSTIAKGSKSQPSDKIYSMRIDDKHSDSQWIPIMRNTGRIVIANSNASRVHNVQKSRLK